ncbi:MAG TPA: heavy metal translocating P-type ATPase [Anaerolineales bacterium]|nr:heavy metal translocating P-type ATPase [Anaerolineales bacterium]
MENTKQTFIITGMDCADCAKTVETGVAKLNGVTSSELNFHSETLHVLGNIPARDVINRIRELGYNVREPQNNKDEAKQIPSLNFLHYMWSRQDTRLALLAILLIIPGLLFHELLPHLGIHHPIIDVMSVGSMVIAGYPIAQSGWRAFKINRQVTINALMSIAAIGAVFIGAYTEAGVVMVLFVIGEALEGFTSERARRSIRRLMAVTPNEAILLEGNEDHRHEKPIHINELKIGDLILVIPGKRIPMDGRVVSGSSSVNQAPITGEAKLIQKNIGDGVFASSVNGEGALEIEVTHLAEDNTISRLIKMVEEAQEKKAPAQRFVDTFASYYTPMVVALAALVAVLPPLIMGQTFFGETGWLYRGLTLLVVACPCALVISTPVSLISAISNAARNGVLFKGGVHIETLAKVNAIAFDKTGTLTNGRPSVVDIRSVECENPDTFCNNCDDLLALASAVEGRSEHPIAQAVAHEARHRGLSMLYPAADNVTTLTGRGVTGSVGGCEVMIGSHPYFDEFVPHTDHCETVAHADASGLTTMMISSDKRYKGFITISDTVRETSKDAVTELKQIGIEDLVMLTGDNATTAKAVADKVGVTDFRAGCLPEDKVSEIERLRNSKDGVVMVGDGINDTPALAAANVGIAIGNTAQAMETADVTLMSDSLKQLPFAIRLSRAAMGTIRANVAMSIGIKVIFLILVLVGLGSMWMAVLADMGTSLLVTLNGMRLLKRPTMNPIT